MLPVDFVHFALSGHLAKRVSRAIDILITSMW